jgi:hypothetical protein
MTQANGDNSPDDPSFPQTPQKADRELLRAAKGETCRHGEQN